MSSTSQAVCVVLLSGLTLVISFSLAAQQGWSIVGTVQTFRGELPDRPIQIVLQFRGNTIATTFCDSEGKFSFSELLANAYHVLINDEKYNPVDQLVEINPMLTAPTMVRINLIPKDNNKVSEPSSGSNPNMVSSVELKQFPKAALKEFDKGRKSEKEGKIDEAIEHYKRAIEVAPSLYSARNNLGSAYLAKSQFGPAQEQFEAVIKANQSDAAAYLNLGNTFLVQNKYSDAVHWLGEGLTREPNNALGHFLMGSTFAGLGRAVLAEKELRIAIQLDAAMSRAHLALVNLYVQLKRNDDAVSELRTFLKAFPNDSFAPQAKQVLKRLETNSAAADQLVR